MHRLPFALAAAVAVGHAAPALACSFAVGFVPTIPFDGDVVPTNPLILVRTDNVSDPRLFDADGVEVPASVSPFSADFASGVRLVPTAPLDDDATYTIRDGDLPDALATFTTSSADIVSPTAPRVSVVDVTAPPAPEDALCSTNGFATLLIESDEPYVVVEIVSFGRPSLAIPVDGRVSVDGIGPVTFDVVGLDAAGNPSEPVSIEVDFGQPPEELATGCGCPSGGDDVVVGAALPLSALGALRRKRRHANAA